MLTLFRVTSRPFRTFFSIFSFSAQFDNNNSVVQAKKGFTYYKPSSRIDTLFSSRFDFRFEQIENSLVTQGFLQKLITFYKWKTLYSNLSVPDSLAELQQVLPVNKNPNFTCAYNKIKYTWIGHSSALISIGNNINILIDPVFSQRCSPFKLFGPKRYREVPCEIQNLPKIDVVLVSHDHYDHLDQYSLNKLQQQHEPHFLAGLNSKDLFPPNCNLHELDWTSTKKIIVNNQQLQITFVPACHWSRRWLFDLGQRLWGGFVIKTSNGKKIYYSGDTGYCELFKEIHDVFGDIDLSIIPIGVYGPRQILKAQHVDPEEAVVIHKQIKSKKSVGVHWGTFPLSSERWDEPLHKLNQAVQKHGLREGEFLAIKQGDSFQIDY